MAAVDVPPGNWLAQEIRRFQEKSTGLFPEEKPGEGRVKYNTVYTIDYAPLGDDAYKPETPVLLRRPGIKKETPFSLSQAKRFNSWKVKKDLIEADKVQQRVADRRRTALEASQSQQETFLPTIDRSQTVDLGAAARSQKPQGFGIHTPVLPNGGPVPSGTPAVAVRSVRSEQAVRQSAPAEVQPADSRKKEIQKELLTAAEDYIKSSPATDRRVIDRALRVSNHNYRADTNVLKSELTDPKYEAEKWLQNANGQEQDIALKFFKSVSGMRLMGLGSRQAHADRLEKLIDTLESGEAKVPVPSLSYEDEQRRRSRRQRNLQFVRLLSPQTRDNRSSHQTWHHLPNYRPVNRADNVRSHYTQPQKIKPLHFTIHPDWGP